MHRILDELTTEYASAAGCACERKEEESHVVLLVEGVRVHVGFLESSGMMLFHTAVATLPPKGEGREELFMKLLGADNLFSGTRGFTLGVDEARQLVTLQLAWDAFHLDGKSFARIVNNLLSVAVEWMIRLEEWRPSPPEGGEERSFMMNFLKV
ncbi:type III secretion system chaperone [Mailhella massiliensis]|uniref:type III secretion system chaperone n=1 Tax=Mailhella massiliensis TaxID=1903261 RepID=UPI00097E14E1|nr:type III secretion system chaperone [Mailhella massiliensis]